MRWSRGGARRYKTKKSINERKDILLFDQSFYNVVGGGSREISRIDGLQETLTTEGRIIFNDDWVTGS